jgi:hypothetical protein
MCPATIGSTPVGKPVTGAPDHALIERGREAMRRHAWDEAYEALSRADREGMLTAEGLKLLGSAAYWTGRPDETVEELERASQPTWTRRITPRGR